MLKRIFMILGALGLMFLMVAATKAADASGPGNASAPNGQIQTVAAHSALWYSFDVGADNKFQKGRHGPNQTAQVTATLDTSSENASGLRFDLYTPGEITAWTNGEELKAIGAGSAMQNHTLGWVGKFDAAGTYYAVVYNDTDAPIDVSVSVTGDSLTTTQPTAAPNPTGSVAIAPASATQSITGKLAFVDSAGGNLYSVNGDGTDLKQIATGVIDPQWSHDGTKIAFARQGTTPGIYVINADGSNVQLLYQTNEARSAEWSPDDSFIIFSFLANSKGGTEKTVTFRGHSFTFSIPENDEWQLALVNSSGGGFTNVQATNHALTPTWNSTNNVIAFNDLTIGIMQMALNNEYTPFPFIGDLRNTETDYNPLRLMSPQYSQDGTKIVYVVQQQPTWQIAVANADGSNQHLLTSDDVLADTHPNNVAPVWSPDSKQILFLSNRDGKWEFFEMDAAPENGAYGTNVHQVLQNVTDQITLNYSYNSDRIMSWTN